MYRIQQSFRSRRPNQRFWVGPWRLKFINMQIVLDMVSLGSHWFFFFSSFKPKKEKSPINMSTLRFLLEKKKSSWQQSMGKQEPFKDPPRRKHQTQSNIHRKNRIVLAYFLVTQPRWIESVRKCATAERRQKAKHLIKDFWMGGWGWRYELVHLKEDGIRTGFCTRYMQIRQKRSCPDTTIHSATTRATLK